MKTLLLIATYCEAANLPTLLQRVLALDCPPDVLFIDNNSPDGTGRIADAWAAAHSCVCVLHRERKEGLGSALSDGFKWASSRHYDFIANLDGDLSHDPKELPRLLAALQEGPRADLGSLPGGRADMVIGSRYANGIRVLNWAPYRLFLSLLAGRYVRWTTHVPIHDPTSGYRCLRKDAVDALLQSGLEAKGYAVHIEMTYRLWRLGMNIREVPITFSERAAGTTKLSGRIIVEALWLTCWLRLRGALAQRNKPVLLRPSPRPRDQQNSLAASPGSDRTAPILAANLHSIASGHGPGEPPPEL